MGFARVWDLVGATPLKKTDSPFPISHQLGVEAHESLPAPHRNADWFDFVQSESSHVQKMTFPLVLPDAPHGT